MNLRSLKSAILPLLLAVACTSTPPAPPDPAAQQIDAFVRRAMTAFPEVPAMGVAVVRDGKTILTAGYGMRDVEQQLPATDETVFYIASSTKSYVGLLTAILAARGTVDLDVPVTRYLPEVHFGAGIDPAKVTLRTLLTHSAGISNDAMVMRTAFSGEHTSRGLVELLGRSKAIEPKFEYDNLGYVVAGLVLERVTGKPWQELLATEVFAPLGMTRTTASMTGAAAWPVAKPYDLGRDLHVHPIATLKNDATMHAAGGIVTTPRDLARWLEANVNAGRVSGRQAIPAVAFAEAQKQQVVVPETNWYRFRRLGYAFGWYHSDYEGTKMLHHFGGYEGWRAHVSFLPEQRHGVAAVVNTGAPGAQLRDVVAAYAYDVLLGKPDVDAAYAGHLAKLRADTQQQLDRVQADLDKRNQRPPSLTRPAATYAGTYENDSYGRLQVRAEGTELRASIGQLAATLEPFTQPDTARVELIPGTGEVLGFVFDGGAEQASAVKYRDEVFRRVE